MSRVSTLRTPLCTALQSVLASRGIKRADFRTLQAAAPVAGAIVVCDQGRHASTSAGLGALGLAAGIVALGVPAAVADSQTQERTRSWEELETPEERLMVLQSFWKWLEEGGANLHGIEIRGAQDPDVGLAMHAAKDAGPGKFRWWAPWTYWPSRRPAMLAQFPMTQMLTHVSAAQHPHKPLATLFEFMLQNGTIDESLALMLFLMVERARGSQSHVAPYMAALPATFASPLFYTAEELTLLRGTTLADATSAKQQQLVDVFQRIQPSAQTLWKAAQLAGEPSLTDFAWAYSIYWSRAKLVPDVNAEQPQVPESNTLDADQELPQQMIVALVPGLEFCNHSPRPNATWALEETQSADKPPEYVSLMSAPSVGLRKHQEVLIDYGDKSNEELLFHYGFVVEDNPQDALMMHYELPAEDKMDDAMKARVHILRSHMIPLQHFLVRADLSEYVKAAHADRAADGPFPAEALRALQVLVMTDEEAVAVRAAMDASIARKKQAEQHADDDGNHDSAASIKLPDSLGSLRTRALAKMVEHLEAKVAELELCCGSAEFDRVLLQEKLPRNARNCIVYRLGQKDIARGYLDAAKELVTKDASN